MFAKNAGLGDVPHIPYKGGAEIASDLVAGRLPMAFDAAPQGIQTAKTGKAKIIAVAAPQRVAALPDVPTVLEQGVKDIDLLGFPGLVRPGRHEARRGGQAQRGHPHRAGPARREEDVRATRPTTR